MRVVRFEVGIDVGDDFGVGGARVRAALGIVMLVFSTRLVRDGGQERIRRRKQRGVLDKGAVATCNSSVV